MGKILPFVVKKKDEKPAAKRIPIEGPEEPEPKLGQLTLDLEVKE